MSYAVPAFTFRSWRVVVVLVSLVFVSILSKNALAQATSGTLTGVVTDPTGAVIPNAQVKITDTQHGSSVTAMTNGDGLFTRTQLANSTYNVSVNAQGFQPTQQNNIVVDVDRETRINVTMQLGSASQTVQVVANEAPVLQSTTGTCHATRSIGINNERSASQAKSRQLAPSIPQSKYS